MKEGQEKKNFLFQCELLDFDRLSRQQQTIQVVSNKRARERANKQEKEARPVSHAGFGCEESAQASVIEK